MLHKSQPKISDAAPKWFTQYAVFSIYYCGLYSLHTSIQTLFEPLKLSEKIWRRLPNLSTTTIYKMVEKRKKWQPTPFTQLHLFSVSEKKLLLKSHTTKIKSFEPSQMSEKLWQKQRNPPITPLCKMVEKENKNSWHNNEKNNTTTTSFSPWKKRELLRKSNKTTTKSFEPSQISE